jgi:hypothetical protein
VHKRLNSVTDLMAMGVGMQNIVTIAGLTTDIEACGIMSVNSDDGASKLNLLLPTLKQQIQHELRH